MKISDAFLKIQIGANLTPEAPNLGGMTSAGIDFHSKPADIKSVLAARMVFSGTQWVTFSAITGSLTASATGVAQVETATVVAAAGATASGNLALTLTGSYVVGSPLAISVPLTVFEHGTAALIAAAIRAKLNSLPAVTNFFTVGGEGAAVVLTSIWGFPNDTGLLNLAITAGLGVTGAPASTNSVAGVAGVLITRTGGNSKDVYGMPWKTCERMAEYVATIPAPSNSSLTGNIMGNIYPKSTKAVLLPAYDEETWDASGRTILDVIIFCK